MKYTRSLSHSNAAALATSALLAVGLAGCGLTPTMEGLTVEQGVAVLNGRHMAVNVDLTEYFRKITQGLGAKCAQEGGKFFPVRIEPVTFKLLRTWEEFAPHLDRNIPIYYACEVERRPVWGMSLQLDSPRYTWAMVGGPGALNYYAQLRTRYETAAEVQAKLDFIHNEGAELLARQGECIASKYSDTANLRTHPAVGNETDRGLIVDVRMPLVLLQYTDHYIHPINPQWVPANTLEGKGKC